MPYRITTMRDNKKPLECAERLQGFNWISRHPHLAVGFLVCLLDEGRLSEIDIAELQQLHLRLGALVQRSLQDP